MLYLGRDYPDGFDVFRSRLQKAFRKNSSERDPKKVAQLIAQAEFVIKEIEALYMLRKYRSLKRRYYDWESCVNVLLMCLYMVYIIIILLLQCTLYSLYVMIVLSTTTFFLLQAFFL